MSDVPPNAILAAVAAAVKTYIETEECASSPAPKPSDRANGVGSYAASGRQQSMELRRMVSLRLLRR